MSTNNLKSFVNRIFELYKKYKEKGNKIIFKNLYSEKSTEDKVNIFEYFLDRTNIFQAENIDTSKKYVSKKLKIILKNY